MSWICTNELNRVDSGHERSDSTDGKTVLLRKRQETDVEVKDMGFARR